MEFHIKTHQTSKYRFLSSQRKEVIKLDKAYGYLRVSAEGQLEGDGPARQKEKITRYCNTNRIEVTGWYSDTETGTKQNRPELARLMVDLETNGHEVKTVVIERLDRLARDLMVQEAIIRDLGKKGVQLVSADEGQDLAGADPTRKLVRQVLGAIAEYEKTMLVLKLKAARERKRKRTGKCEGRKRYGEQSEEERKVICRIKLLRRRRRGGYSGMTYQAIAERLNGEGILTRQGKRWTAQLVHHICTKL
jgi:DNA invertase Pin-like site-specific DNA recombinase